MRTIDENVHQYSLYIRHTRDEMTNLGEISAESVCVPIFLFQH